MLVGFDESDTVDLVGKTPGNVTIVASRTLVTLACFAAGTAILTAHGETAVERLGVGDLLPRLAGDRLARVVWLGHRDIDCARHRLGTRYSRRSRTSLMKLKNRHGLNRRRNSASE